MNAVWKDIRGFEDKYQVNASGEILNKQTGRCLKATVDKVSGYVKVALLNEKHNTLLVHRLVAEAFIPNPNNHPQVHHKDGNKQNNCVDNLEWVSHKAHGGKMSAEQKAKFRETYQKNLKKRKKLSKCYGLLCSKCAIM